MVLFASSITIPSSLLLLTMYVINQLGKRFEKLTVINEKDCIKFKQKCWIEREVWREINDILRVNGFSWLSNGKDSCWIRMLN